MSEDVTGTVKEEKMWDLPGYSEEVFLEKYANFPTKEPVENGDSAWQTYCNLLNLLSEYVRDRLG